MDHQVRSPSIFTGKTQSPNQVYACLLASYHETLTKFLPMCLPLRFFGACHEHKLRMVTWTCCASYECKSDCYKILIQQKWRMTGKTLRPWGYRSSCLERGLQATASNGRRLCSPCGSNFGHAQEVVWKISGKVPTTCNGVVQIVTPLWQSWPWNVQVYKWLQDNYSQISSYSTDAYEHQAVCIIYHKQALSYMRAAIWALHKSKNLFVFWFGGGYGCKFNLLCHSDRPSSVRLVLAHLSLIITWKYTLTDKKWLMSEDWLIWLEIGSQTTEQIELLITLKHLNSGHHVIRPLFFLVKSFWFFLFEEFIKKKPAKCL